MLQTYYDNGFKFIHCNPDKTPKKAWRRPENHLSLEVATELLKTGEMIGAIIPDDIVVIDLDRHEGKPDGIKTFIDLKDKYNFSSNITAETFCVKTGGGGYHIFLYVGKDHGLNQGEKAPGIDLKTGAGYVITAGSPGYRIHDMVEDLDIIEMPETIKIWLESVKPEKKKEVKQRNTNTIPIDLLNKILQKLDVKEFNSEERWYNFIVSAIAATGASQDVFDLLVDWSGGDSSYKDVRNRVESFDVNGGITTGTFVHIIKEYGITQYYIKKVLSFNTSIELYENMRDDGSALPFSDPDYDEISDSKEARELFITGGNSVAATLLGFAIHGYIIWCEADKAFFLFDGNRWIEYNDMFTITYTVLIRLTKFMYAKKKGSDVDNENFIKLVKIINKTHWKRETINELKCRDGVFHKKALWDSEKLKETLTTLDGVIDFTNNHIFVKKGLREEFRKSFINYKSNEIIEAGEPIAYNKFLRGLFHDNDTFFTARQAISMFISGNAKKVFQIYHGGGDNGKSTLIEIEKELLDNKAHTYSTSLILNNKFGDDKLPPEAADFMGKYVLFGSEVEKGKKLSLGKIKNFTGDDTIGATPKYKDERIFRPTWQMVLSVNDLPFFDGADIAFINRLVILPFDQTFVSDKKAKDELIKKGFNPDTISFKIDSDVLKKGIRKEFPSVILQKINDYVELKKGYNGIIKQSNKCIIHKNAYITENNDIENFIIEMCVVSLEGNLFETTEIMTEAYREYSGINKISPRFMALNLKKARQEVKDGTRSVDVVEKDITTGIFRTILKRKRGLLNIRLKTTEEGKEMELQENLEKEHSDNIPF